MPFKNISTPKTLATLDGEVRAAAWLKNPGLVALCSSDPSQLWVAGLTGQNAKVSKAGLAQIDDLGLLSRDVAVVRSGNEAWALLGIAHTAKMDRVSDDVRSLAFRPTGQTALILGWGGNATELAVKGNDVVARPFTLRSPIRSSSIGETECYVVADGGEGEFRIHPGATPEPGSTAKTTMPASSKKLDRLAGGKFFSAAWGPGSPEIIAFTRAGNRVDAKTLRLDAPVSSVAVAETSLLVGTGDGRIHLYDKDAIQGATSLSIEAKHVVDVGGEPKVILVVNQQIFVGTATGEIKTSTLARGEVVV
jgi:hypothetical protein